jgi:LmbE family N-acetylglucosaminyl deacetylase
MLNKIKNYYRNLNTLKLIYGNELVGSFLSLRNVNRVADKPPVSGRVLVIAPHPDDELIGLGGTIKLHVKAKDRVKVVYVTDGSSGFPSNYRPTSREKREMADRRELEAREGMELIGVDDLVFLGYKDGSFVVNESASKYTFQLLRNFKPDIIYMPYFFDSNRDHQHTLKLMMQVVGEVRIDIKIAMYEIWEPLNANFFVCIDSVVSDKENALKIHKSQLDSVNYLYAAMGLSAYRGAISGAGDYAEAFLVLESDIASKLYRKLSRVIN